jgi:hypothetical protein
MSALRTRFALSKPLLSSTLDIGWGPARGGAQRGVAIGIPCISSLPWRRVVPYVRREAIGHEFSDELSLGSVGVARHHRLTFVGIAERACAGRIEMVGAALEREVNAIDRLPDVVFVNVNLLRPPSEKGEDDRLRLVRALRVRLESQAERASRRISSKTEAA